MFLFLIMNYLIIILMFIILYLNYVNSNKIVLKLRRTDNYRLLYNYQNQTSFYTNRKLLT